MRISLMRPDTTCILHQENERATNVEPLIQIGEKMLVCGILDRASVLQDLWKEISMIVNLQQNFSSKMKIE